ncbi:hypothetical protein SASPL_152507 [Salvia splendens]|uniref:Uncharacterized protein n=1 Tax=Salvia splendens TaxID=180675 RepID=A0A8X8W3A3_SALSN|nr:hypothetical protein SASPL_152507 [Salvia splendens]
MNTSDPAVDKNDVTQPVEVPKKTPGKKKESKGNENIHEGVERGEADAEKIRHETLKLKTKLKNFGIAEVTGKMAYDMIKEYNWCAYVLETLAVAAKNWKTSKNAPFTGLISFLVAFYVDRVFHKKLLVSRVFPNVFGWTSEKLRQREKMELESGDTIGRGSVVDREASEDAVRGLEKLMRSMNDLTNLIQNFEALKIAGSTACNMIGVIPEVEVDEEETVASLKTALAKDQLNVPELVEVVQSMFNVTAQLTQLAEEGPPFDIHPSFLPKNVS